jgi:hypothetical protein
MPCNSDHMEANGREKQLSKVACLIDEVTDRKPINPDHWRGYHPAVYNRLLGKDDADEMVAKLCALIQKQPDVSTFSLELQMWWRDHQAADKARIETELRLQSEAGEREVALAKLTPYERKLLGLER